MRYSSTHESRREVFGSGSTDGSATPGGRQRARREHAGRGCGDAECEPGSRVRLAGDVPGRRLGRTGRPEARWSPAEAGREAHGLGLQDRGGEEPPSDEVLFRPLDAGHGEDRHPQTVRDRTEPLVGRAPDGPARPERAAAPVEGLPAGSEGRSELAGEGVSPDLPRGESLRGEHIFRGRGRRAVRRAQREDLGSERPDADRVHDRGALRHELDIRREPHRTIPFRSRRGACDSGGVHRVSPPADPRPDAARVSDRRRASHPQGGLRAEVHRVGRAPLAPVFPAAVFPRVEPRRARLERPQEPHARTEGHHRAGPDAQGGALPPEVDGKDSAARRVVLPRAGNKVCKLSPYYYGKISKRGFKTTG